MRVRPFRRTVEGVKFAPGHLLVLLGQAGQFLLEFGLGYLGHVGVIARVIAHNMPLVAHTLGQLGRCVQIVADHEKCRRCMVLFEHVQNLGRVAVLVTTVESQINDFAVRVAHVVRPVLRQRLHAILATRRLSSSVSVP